MAGRFHRSFGRRLWRIRRGRLVDESRRRLDDELPLAVEASSSGGNGRRSGLPPDGSASCTPMHQRMPRRPPSEPAIPDPPPSRPNAAAAPAAAARQCHPCRSDQDQTCHTSCTLVRFDSLLRNVRGRVVSKMTAGNDPEPAATVTGSGPPAAAAKDRRRRPGPGTALWLVRGPDHLAGDWPDPQVVLRHLPAPGLGNQPSAAAGGAVAGCVYGVVAKNSGQIGPSPYAMGRHHYRYHRNSYRD